MSEPAALPQKVRAMFPDLSLAGAFVIIALLASVFVSDWPLWIGAWLENDLFVRYWPRIVEGFGVTLSLVALSVSLGALLALPVALARLRETGVLAKIAFGYVYFFRGTPILAQTYLVYYGTSQFVDPEHMRSSAGLWSFLRESYWYALATFTLNTAAYQAEILRGAILAVGRGQWEGARALGLSQRMAFIKVILPQALITALRPFGNEIVLMIKASAIASVVAVHDIMGETRIAYSRSYDFQVYLWAAVIYLSLVETLRRIWDWLELRLTRHLAMR